MRTYRINGNEIHKEIYSSSLRLGGTNPDGDSIRFTNYYMEWNGEPFFGRCGEFHFSRYPEDGWEEAIGKLKAAGLNILATYLFWNHHEEEEGIFRWDGNLNIRKFVELCAKHGMSVILRVGPFCHGECRNGGMPDWLYGRPFEIRSNDALYLDCVKRLYGEIGKQVHGLMFKDGGPVIAVQLENEFMHASAIWETTAKQGDEYMNGGTGGAEHMAILKQIAIEAGLVAPIYTSTGWGGAPVLEDEVLPLYGGYAYTPWNINEDQPEQPPTTEYTFQNYHDDQAKAHGFEPPYPPTKYPFACCEMGGGMQDWYQGRFIVDPESVDAMTIQKIAGGCNFVGYYVFHGGTQRVGVHGFTNEGTVPKLSYDYQAPVGEFGQIRPSYRRLKPILYFLEQFGSGLCPMATVLPEGAEGMDAKDTDSLRYAARVKGRSGYIFLNNYQDHVEMKDQQDIQLSIELGGETIVIPESGSFTLRAKESAILPVGLQLDGVTLRYATAQPITRVEDEGTPTYFFFVPDGLPGEFSFAADGIARIHAADGTVEAHADRIVVRLAKPDASLIEIAAADGRLVRICVLSRSQSLQLWVTDIRGRRSVILTDAGVTTEEGGRLTLLSSGSERIQVRVFPAVDAAPEVSFGTLDASREGLFAVWTIGLEKQEICLELAPVGLNKMVVKPAAAFEGGLHEAILQIRYRGDVGNALIGGRLINDHFCNGAAWEIGLRRHMPEALAEGISLYVTPKKVGTLVTSDSAMAIQHQFLGTQIAEIESVQAVPVYRTSILF